MILIVLLDIGELIYHPGGILKLNSPILQPGI